MDTIRIPPAVAFVFEQYASKICDEAKVDYEERPFIARELQNHLNHFWKRAIADGKSTDDAETAAIVAFGNVENVARSIRQPYWKRLLFFERCRAARFIWFMIVGAVINFFCTVVAIDPNKTHQISNWVALGYMLNPIYAIISLLVIKWKPKTTFLKIAFSIRYLLFFCVFTGVLNVFLVPAIYLFRSLHEPSPANWNWQADLFLNLCLTILVILGWIAGFCFLSELFSWPRKYARKQKTGFSRNQYAS